MATPTTSGLLVWRRDLEPESRTWVKWVIAGIVALAGFGAFAAYMADDAGSIGTFIGLGVIGSVLFWLIPVVYDWARRRNPEITIEGRDLCWSKKRVPIDQVERWRAAISTSTAAGGTTTAVRTRVGLVTFEMMDDTKQVFSFTHLGEDELVTLIEAIDPILPGRRTA